MIYFFIIILTVIVSFFRTLRYGYIIDDGTGVKIDNRWKRLAHQLNSGKCGQPVKEHLISIIVHLVVCELIYLAFGQSNVSFMAAMLYAVHPVGTQGSVWLSGRNYELNVIFVIIMWWICPLAYFITPYFAVNALAAPLLFFPYQWAWVLMIPIYLLLAKSQRKAIGHRFEMATGKGSQIHPVKIIIALKTLGYYTCLSLIPTRLGIYHNYLYTYSLSKKDNDYWERLDRFFWVGVAVIVTLCLTRNFWLFWFVLFMVQWLNVCTLSQSIAERYLSIPLVGMMFFLASGITFIPYPWNIISFVVIFTYYFTRLQFHLPSYRDLEACVVYNTINFPELYVCWTWRGQVEKDNKRFFTALESWMRGWKMRPEDFRLNNNIAVMLTDMGYLDDAEAFIKNGENNIIPEQKKAADEFIAAEWARIARARILLNNKAVEEKKRKKNGANS